MGFDLVQRAVLWLAGLALPATPLLQQRLHHAVKAVLCAVIGGVMISALLLSALYGAYLLMLAKGVSVVLAFLSLGAITLVSSLYFIFKALGHVNRAAYVKDDLRLFSGYVPAVPPAGAPSPLFGLGSAFLEGLLSSTMPPAPVRDPLHPVPPYADPAATRSYRQAYPYTNGTHAAYHTTRDPYDPRASL